MKSDPDISRYPETEGTGSQADRVPIEAFMRRWCVYRLFDEDGRLLYVGQSSNATARIAAHRSQQSWGRDIESVAVEYYPDEATAKDAERQVIQAERPAFNVLLVAGTWVHNVDAEAEALRASLDRAHDKWKAANDELRPLEQQHRAAKRKADDAWKVYERAGRVVGIEGPHFTGPRLEWTDDHGQRIWVDMWDCKDEGAYPRAARYLIHIAGDVVPVNGTAPWLEFCQRGKDGKLLETWLRMPTTMLAKTALSLGLRRSGVENLPADIPVAYEGDTETVAELTPGDTPGPAEHPPPAGPGPTHDIVADDGTLFTCTCGRQFSSGGAFHRHRVEAQHFDQPPQELYDSTPESRNYDDAQPASYEDPDDEDYGRPFGDDE